MCTKSKKVPAFFWSVLRYYIPSFEKKYEKLHKRATVYSHFLHIYFLFGNIQLANTLSKHSIFWGVRRFTGVLRSIVYHVYRLIVGQFQLTTIFKINTFQKHINYLKRNIVHSLLFMNISSILFILNLSICHRYYRFQKQYTTTQLM